MEPVGAKCLRHDFAEPAIENRLVVMAGKRNHPVLVEHIEPVFLQLWLQQLAHVRLDQDQRDLVPASSQQLLKVAAKLRVLPDDREIAVAVTLVVRVHLFVRRVDEQPAPVLELAQTLSLRLWLDAVSGGLDPALSGGGARGR